VVTVTVLVPVYNEEKTILEILQRISAQHVEGVTFEVIVVDDGSADRTPDLLAAHPDLYAQNVRMPVNGGKGAAVRAGLHEATGDFILFQDADLEYDPADYVKLMRPVLQFDADVVMGSRVMAPEYTRVHYFWHLVGNRMITLMFNVFFNMTFTDIYSYYLMYRRDLVEPEDLRSDGWDQHAEILARVVKAADVVYEVPVSYHGRSYAEGKKIKAVHALSVFWMILRQRFSR